MGMLCPRRRRGAGCIETKVDNHTAGQPQHVPHDGLLWQFFKTLGTRIFWENPIPGSRWRAEIFWRKTAGPGRSDFDARGNATSTGNRAVSEGRFRSDSYYSLLQPDATKGRDCSTRFRFVTVLFTGASGPGRLDAVRFR